MNRHSLTQNVRVTNGDHGTYTLTASNIYAPDGSVIRGIQTLSDVVFLACTDESNLGEGDPLAGLAVPPGVYMEGRWTFVEVTSGTVRLYLEPA